MRTTQEHYFLIQLFFNLWIVLKLIKVINTELGLLYIGNYKYKYKFTVETSYRSNSKGIRDSYMAANTILDCLTKSLSYNTTLIKSIRIYRRSKIYNGHN